MTTQGEVQRIAGPVVTAIGISPRMYDVVFVGEERLMGEVIRLSGNKSIIQVYEETTGVKPGEPVVNTAMPLSVELGPGLIASIYDGIQRPLPELMSIQGDHISRGASLEGLDRKKTWHFVPSVQKGDAVVQGQRIGIVKETDHIEHMINVPPGTRQGSVSEISEGDFTVEDVVCTLSSGASISLMHKWPVREPRPFSEKLMPDVPLLTGQRVLDMFFPLAKGGTAAIPGGFGTGKCVTGETPIIMGDGSLRTMKEVYLEYHGKGVTQANRLEDVTYLRNGIPVFSLNGGKIKKKSASAVYRGKTDKLYHIRTRTGRIVEITPAHKLFKVTRELRIAETPAALLRKGDFLAAPRKLRLKGRRQGIDCLSIFNEERVCDPDILNELSRILDDLTKKNRCTKKELAESLGVSYDVLIGYSLKKNRPTVSFVRTLWARANKKPSITRIKSQRAGRMTRIPSDVDRDFAEFLGLVLGDGTLKASNVIVYNNDKHVLDRFEMLAKGLFELEGKRGVANTVRFSSVGSRVLVKLLRHVGVPARQKSRRCHVPKIIMSSPDSVISAFLGAYFVCDGHTGGKELEIGTASKDMMIGISYLLLRLGIVHSLKERVVEGKKQYRIFMRGKDAISGFYEHCRFHHEKFEKMDAYLRNGKRSYRGIDIVPASPAVLQKMYDDMGRPHTELENIGVNTSNYFGMRSDPEKMSAHTYRKFASLSNDGHCKKFAESLTDIFCDEIVEIEEIAGPTDVYDITVPDGGNFVGGFGPLLLHNTVTQHQLAKWSDSDIVVYVGCGERGNEMTEVLTEFPELEDPRTGSSLIERTVLIANTSNMPVAAREASVYTGMTIAEYYRDMGMSISLMADSTSRWAEAMREISSRLEEMPGEEGYPAYLSSRLSEFYERAGRVMTLEGKKGAISVIGAVSPQGGDFSEPVTQGTLRIVKVFWALDTKLRERRHFPAINWLNSYSLYSPTLADWFSENVAKDWPDMVLWAMGILQREAELQEIVQLVGSDALPDEERLILEVARMIREFFLQQDAYHPVDTYCPAKNQYRLMASIREFHDRTMTALKSGVNFTKILEMKSRQELSKAKYEEDFDKYLDEVMEHLRTESKQWEGGSNED